MFRWKVFKDFCLVCLIDWRFHLTPTLTVLPSLCPNCCCHQGATVSSAAEWLPSPDQASCQTVHEKTAWAGWPTRRTLPLSARDCDNDLSVHGDNCHACGCDSAAHREKRKREKWSVVVYVETSKVNSFLLEEMTVVLINAGEFLTHDQADTCTDGAALIVSDTTSLDQIWLGDIMYVIAFSFSICSYQLFMFSIC